MDLPDSRLPHCALLLVFAMHKWLPKDLVADLEAAKHELDRDALRVHRIDEQGRRIFDIDPHSDHNRRLLLRVRETQIAAEDAFLPLLRSGRLVAWAREGNPMAELRRIPADAWTTLRFVHVLEARAGGHGVELFGIHIAAAAAAAEPAPAAPSPPEPVVTAEGPPPRTDAAQAVYTPEALRAWFLLRVKTWPKGQPPPREADCIAAAKAYFADAPGRDEFREIRRQKTPEDWRKRGPKPRG